MNRVLPGGWRIDRVLCGVCYHQLAWPAWPRLACIRDLGRARVLTPWSLLYALTTTVLCGSPTQPSPAGAPRRSQPRASAIEKESVFKNWIDEILYITTEEEKVAWGKLTTDEARRKFIADFWERRNPEPGSPENEFKEEYYRRVAFSRQHFSPGAPDSGDDRRRIYIWFGPPDEIDSLLAGAIYQMPPERGKVSTKPFVQWKYRFIDGIGKDVIFDFNGPSKTREYHLTVGLDSLLKLLLHALCRLRSTRVIGALRAACFAETVRQQGEHKQRYDPGSGSDISKSR